MHKIKRNLELVINPNETELIKIIADTNIINFWGILFDAIGLFDFSGWFLSTFLSM